jgi:hypothetical protein
MAYSCKTFSVTMETSIIVLFALMSGMWYAAMDVQTFIILDVFQSDVSPEKAWMPMKILGSAPIVWILVRLGLLLERRRAVQRELLLWRDLKLEKKIVSESQMVDLHRQESANHLVLTWTKGMRRGIRIHIHIH